MTTAYRRTAKCPNCYFEIPLEDEMSQWVRTNKSLDSGYGFTFMDKDIICHRTKTSHGKDFQCIMFVEVKSRMKKLEISQRDTMMMVDQMFRRDRTTPTKKARLHDRATPGRVYSVFSKKWVNTKPFGFHLLTLSGCTPDDSEKIFWDKRRPIDRQQLIQLLRFDLHPDTLEPMDFRVHHSKGAENLLIPGL